MPSSGMLHRVALARTDVSEERIASVNTVTRIDKLRKSELTSSRSTLRRKRKQGASVASYCYRCS
jgi:hypothetical protein